MLALSEKVHRGSRFVVQVLLWPIEPSIFQWPRDGSKKEQEEDIEDKNTEAEGSEFKFL